MKRTSSAGPDYQIHMNFLAVAGELPTFTLYRQRQVSAQQRRPAEQIGAYRLPVNALNDGDWPLYWVSSESMDGFELFEIAPTQNPYLMCRILFLSLLSSTRRTLDPQHFLVPRNSFINEVSFVQESHDEGDELLVVQPYFLRLTRQFGFLVDFHFRLRQGIPFSRRVQQLSLSLDRSFRRNLDYYVDRTTRVQAFLKQRRDVLDALCLPGHADTIALEMDFTPLPAERLRTKVYVFSGNRESKSQFTGLRDHGPLKPLDRPPRLLFIFRERDRQAARRLAISLRGTQKRERFSFPGFTALFKCDLQVDSNPVIVPDLSRAAIEDALERAKKDRLNEANIVPILVLPRDDDSYLIQKAIFSNAEIPTQVCTLPILQNDDTLKWAIANLALQIFCKAGGYPWKVRPTTERSLIIGVSQSHKTRVSDGVREIEKYFAFSVMTDNSGLFQKIQVLSEDQSQEGYLATLRRNLATVLSESAEQFSRVVVHTSFKLKHREIDAIREMVGRMVEGANPANCKFAVVKVNQRTRFFGINRDVNSLVPYEATQVKLGPGEYLVWFEGIFPDRPTVNKVFPGPTHLQVLRIDPQHEIPEDVLLQDLVNLSGANWRGFNAKSTPVSVFYCHLVADLVQNFHERGLPLPALKDMRPWFL